MKPAGQPVSPVVDGFEQIFPPDPTKVKCLLCQEMVPNVARHLQGDHPKVDLAAYIAQFPDTQLEGAPPPEGAPLPISVTAKEAAEHPGGRHGAEIEKMLPRTERRFFREDIQSLCGDGYPSGYQVATVAYLMALARRVRLSIEKTRAESHGKVTAGEDLALLESLETKIASNLRDLEKIRGARLREGDDPLSVIEKTLDEAEAFVRAHQGEFVTKCHGCGAIVTPSGLPFWAYAPVDTPSGPEQVVWSRELWRLVHAGTIPVWVMAFVLRTSPEGIRMIARRRGESWPKSIVLEAEERALREVLDAQDRDLPASSAPSAPAREETL